MHALCVAVLVKLAVTADEPPPPPPAPPPGLDQPPPAAPTEAQPEVPSATSKVRKPPEKPAGWARGAAYVGFGLGAITLGLAVTALIVNAGDPSAGLALAVPGIIINAAGPPIVFFGARSARFDNGIKGSTLLRVLGWIGYAASLVCWFLAFAVGPAAFVAGILGAGSFIAFGVDGILCAQEAEDLASIMTQAPPPDGVQVSPKFSLVRYRGEVSPVIGLQGVF
jgi:hypothetical protein